MNDKIIGWAVWHPVKGFDEFAYEGPVVYADLDDDLLEEIDDMNESDGTDRTTGWRIVKVEVRKIGERDGV